jgi:hypothetical protein
MISQVEGEAFAFYVVGYTKIFLRECFAPTGFQEMWVMHSPKRRGAFRLPLPYQGRGLGG